MKLLRFAGDIDADLPGAGRDKLRRQRIGAAEEQSDITVPQYFLPLVIRVSVLKSGQVLKYTGHADVARADYADLSGEIRDNTTGAELLTQYMDWNRKPSIRAILICIPHELDKDE